MAYDTSAGILFTIRHVNNTVIPCVLCRCEFWFFFSIHVVFFVLFRLGFLEGAHQQGHIFHISWDGIKIVASMATFFEVFYTNQCYHRYLHLYDHCRKMLRHLYCFVMEVRTHMTPAYKQHTRLASRYVMSSMLLFFFEISGSINRREWRLLKDQGLLKEDEVAFLEHLPGAEKSMFPLLWACEIIRLGHIAVKSVPNTLSPMINKVLAVYDTEQTLLDTLRLPVPFQYFHLLNIMVFVNLVVWAYGLGVNASIFSPFIYFFAELIFIGMMELASQLSNPFGQDEVDFPLSTWLTEALECTSTLIEGQFQGADNEWKDTLANQHMLMLRPKDLMAFHEELQIGFTTEVDSAEDMTTPRQDWNPKKTKKSRSSREGRDGYAPLT